MITSLFVVWGIIVGLVFGFVWTEISKKTRMYGWSDDRDVIGWALIVLSFVLSLCGATFGYGYSGLVAGATMPILCVLAAVVVVESLWSGIPALWAFFNNRLERLVDASAEAIRAFGRSWSESAPLKPTRTPTEQ